ncbi:uncharacterized protein LOC130712550 [Lotus japonicus]|uniref:uncharacterized protein LOC130712550 n=1 Tax=Lotus japonicus TaxID=34305 RepID=UPI00258F939D|nr:uncharacterized protein LOC130712550 [Lotus japonicus]
MRSQGCSNKELAKLLLEAEIEDMNRVGKRRKDPGSEARNPLWCEYHNLEGHNTTDCFMLKGQIRQLIRARRLQAAKGKEFEEADSGEGRGTIEATNTIAGGFEVCSDVLTAGRGTVVATTLVQVYPGPFECPHPDIVMSTADFKGIKAHTDDPLVAMVKVKGFNVQRVLLDQGSSADIIYEDAFRQMGLTDKDLKPYTGSLVGFSGKQVQVRGYVELDTVFGVSENAELLRIKYLVLRVAASYNVIIGRGTLNRLHAVISTAHLAVKYPLLCGRIVKLAVDQKGARKCHSHCLNLYGRKGAGDGHRCHEIGTSEGGESGQERLGAQSQSDGDGRKGKNQGEESCKIGAGKLYAQKDNEWYGEN